MTQSGLLLVIGVISSVAAVNGIYLNFVKPSLRVPILAAALVLLLMGAYGVWEDRRHPERHEVVAPASVEQGHDHARGPRVGWLLVVPFLLLGVVVPPPLGAYSAAEDPGLISITTAEGLPPLAEGDPVDLTLAEFQGRALGDPDRSLEGRRVRLVGFASPGRGGEWVLTRMSLNCCAADGFAVKVRVEGAPAVADDEWVEVTGTWRPEPLAAPESQQLPVLVVQDLVRVAEPENPYE
ncbi:MAG TPA: TIGR03943 family protein [Ornithinibacter sp.]|nr:TIGR03943 family protein [Ornithinibacter sp.]